VGDFLLFKIFVILFEKCRQVDSGVICQNENILAANSRLCHLKHYGKNFTNIDKMFAKRCAILLKSILHLVAYDKYGKN